jgi:hypothetical protein
MFTVRHSRGSVFASRGAKYNVRTDTGACMYSVCRVPAGTHTVERGGTIQLASAVSTRITPDAAYVS